MGRSIKRTRTFAFQCDQDAEPEIPWFLSCICGFTGKPKIVSRKTKKYFYETYRFIGCGEQVWEFYCPHCNKLVDGLFHIEKRSQRFIDFCRIYDNGNKISLSIGVTQYFRQSILDDKVTGRKQYFVRFTLNLDTGRTYLIIQGKIRDVTFSFRKLKSYWTDDFNIGLVRKGIRKVIADWLMRCLKKRGIKHASLPDLYNDDLTQIHISSIFIILRYPVLQHMPFSLWGWMPPQYRKPLEKAKGVADIWAILTGHSGKNFALLPVI